MPSPTPLTSPRAPDVVAALLDRLEFVTAPDGVVYTVPRDPSRPRLAVEASDLPLIASRAVWEELGAVLQPSQRAAIVGTLTAIASDAPLAPVALRAHHADGIIHLDLARDDAALVRVAADGWEVTPSTPNAPLFRRTAASAPLPIPTRGGSRDALRDVLGLPAHDPRWRLIWGWLVAALFEDVPRPMLFVTGAQGSGKSTSARFIRSIVDPGELGPVPSEDDRDRATAAAGEFIPSFDNLSRISRDLSDWLCRVVTGEKVTRRALFTDGALFSQMIRRAAVLTGIALPGGLGNDALERIVHVEFDRIPATARRTESGLQRDFAAAHPGILGALLDDVAGVLAHLPATDALGLQWPRMADFAQVLAALDLHLSLDPSASDSHFGVYVAAVASSLSDRASDDPFVAAVVALAKRSRGTWEGTATELRDALADARPDDRGAYWPTGPSQTAGELMRQSEALRAVGFTVRRVTREGRRLYILAAV